MHTYGGRSRSPQAITTPLEVEDILALVDARPDPRWRFGFQMAAYGLRPEELHHLQLREGRLWCTYEKVASRGKTKPRTLRLLPCDDWATHARGLRGQRPEETCRTTSCMTEWNTTCQRIWYGCVQLAVAGRP